MIILVLTKNNLIIENNNNNNKYFVIYIFKYKSKIDYKVLLLKKTVTVKFKYFFLSEKL